MNNQPIDFASLATALLDRAQSLVEGWLPGGVRQGHEYACADLSGGRGTSCKVNLNTGAWADFSTDDKGGDLISLYAAIHGVNNGRAARMLQDEMGWTRENPRPPSVPKPEVKKRTTWRSITPVPAQAPAADMRHYHYGEPEAVWEYRTDGHLLGYVRRFRTSEGDKEIVPLTWCVNEEDARGLQRWHSKTWDEPRPLYWPGGRTPVDGYTGKILVVEGEKCAKAAQALLPELLVVSWPGGGKVWNRADWAKVAGHDVVLWPDCDAKRYKLSKEEERAGIDPLTKAIMPEAEQPGIKTMRGIAQHLLELGCAVSQCPLPTPGQRPDGWDVADAIAEGWTQAQVQDFLAAAVPVGVNPAAPAPSAAGAGSGGEDRDWRWFLVATDKGAIKVCRENLVMALDGLPAKGVKGIDEAQGVIAFNDFTNNVVKLKPSPWGTAAGEWLEEDELEMGAWLVNAYGMPPMPRAALEEAVKMVAGRHRYHPVRQYLATLEGKWDGTPRLRTWLKRVVNAQAPAGCEEITDQYLARVGSWLPMAMVARVMDPGCKFDYMVVFEGAQGVGKSTLARVLGGAWFSDTGLVLGEKDTYQNLQGIWVQEMGELDSLNRAEITRTKSFISSVGDRFRASFDRRPRDYPRQVVFVGTTNEDHYLTDPTGNRRFWPVRVNGQVDNAWLRENRDQIFAEALQAYDAGHRFHPTPDEQRTLFDPQQNARVVESSIETLITHFLYDDHQVVPHGQENGAFINEITLVDLLHRIGIEVGKLGAGRFHEKQAAAALKRLGWVYGKSSAKGGAKRCNVYKRPLPVIKPHQPADVHSPATEDSDALPV